MKSWFVILLTSLLVIFSSQAQEQTVVPSETESFNVMDEIDPNDPNIEKMLEEYDRIYEEETGESSHLNEPFYSLFNLQSRNTCFRETCAVWAQVVKSTQLLYLYQNGVHMYTWPVSTGVRGLTPNFDTHPNGRVYDRYTSTRFPGGDYQNLGNMPYAVFISGGFAIHGTGQANWKKLGRPASHGCVRVHPDNAFIFNRLVRQVGVRNVWITVQP